MFKFKGISSNDMQVVIEEEEHFIARAARRYEVTEIEGRDGAIFNELGYSYVERPIYVQCLNTNKIDDILAWLDGEGEFEYKGRKTTARFYSQLEPQRETVIRIIDTTFIRDPFWTKLEDEFVEVKGDKEKNAEAENINLKGTIPVKFKKFKISGNSKQETREGKNLTNYKDWITINNVEEITKQEDDEIVCEIPSNNAYGIRDIKRTLKPNTNYTACVDYTFSKPLSQVGTYGIRININGNSTGVMSNGLINFTTDETGLAIMQLYVGFPWSGEAGTLTVKNIRLYEGTYTKETIPEYEEYGAMPSPEFPSEIQNVEGNVNVSVCNKNLIDTDFFTTENFSISEGRYFRYAKLPDNFKTKLAASMVEKTKQSNLVFALTDTIATTVSVGRVLSNGEITNMTYDFTASDNVYLAIGNTNGFTDLEADLQTLINSYSIQIEYGEEVTDYVEHQEQTVTFPLAQGQKLMLGDYLADDGIHHKRTQIELPLVSKLQSTSIGGVNCQFASYLIADIKRENEMSNNFLCEKVSFSGYQFNKYKGYIIQKNFVVLTDLEDTVENINQLLAGTILEYELQNEIVGPYTEEQEEAYNQICNLKAYEGETNIYSTDEISPIFKVTYIEETTEKIENEGNIYSRPILRLKKTSYNNVDLEIAGTRFQYNFNDESYIEIDCEEKTALYEGFNRNRQLTIGYEFPKLAPGENDIKMYEGDCIIEVKRKDRWL